MKAKTKIKTCSLCGQMGHNKRSCPKKPIEDITKNTSSSSEEIIEENISISQSRENLIDDLLDRQAYDIPIDIFAIWLEYKQECKQKEIRYIIDRGLNKDSIKLYLSILKDIEE